jgi:alanyl-tRNA synthetase
MKILSSEIREKYLEFFKSKNHSIIPSAPVVPENDPTVLFNTA